MLCRYSAYLPYLALSHSITAHQEKAMLYVCDYDEDECTYQCFAKVDMIKHMEMEHRLRGKSTPLVCNTANLSGVF